MPTTCIVLIFILLCAIAAWFSYVKPLMKDGKEARLRKEQEEANKEQRAHIDRIAQRERERKEELQMTVMEVLDAIVEGRMAHTITKWSSHRGSEIVKHPGAKLLVELTKIPNRVGNLELSNGERLKRHNDLVNQVKEVHKALAPYA